MAVGVDEYVQQILQLLPRGLLQVIGERGEALFRRLLESFADRFFAVHLRAEALLDETDPTLTEEALVDFERMLGLPDDCAPLGATVQQRRVAILQRLTSEGGQSPAFYIALAEQLGHTGATVEEFDYFRADDPTDSPVYDDPWKFAWRLRSPQLVAITYFRADESSADEPLESFGNDLLECVIEELKPAHTTVIVAYGS